MGDAFDDEVEAALAHPKMTYAMAEKVKAYPAWARAKVTSHAHQTATTWWNEVRHKTSELIPRLDSLRERYDQIEAAIDDGSMSAMDAIKAMDNLRATVAAEERRYTTLERQHERADEVHADPVGHMENLFQTHPSLADRRPSLSDYLGERTGHGPSMGLGFHGRQT